MFVIQHVGTGICLARTFSSKPDAENWMRRDKRFEEPFWKIVEFLKEGK